MNPNKALWEKGDFTRIAEGMRESGEALVADIGIGPVCKCSISVAATARPPCLLRGKAPTCSASTSRATSSRPGTAGRRRRVSRTAGSRRATLRTSKVSATIRSTLTVSIFGAMFAPKPCDVAKEMVRVTRPGGRIVMGNWIPNDPTLVAQILKISSAYSPPPPEGFVSPMTWGVEERGHRTVHRRRRAVREHRVPNGTRIASSIPPHPPSVVGEFRNYYGPTMNAFAAAEENGRTADLEGELVSLFEAQNESGDENATSIPATFLRVTVSL